MEDLVIVESKDYAQVVFEDVRECYAESHSVECFFNLNELLKASDADWIGVYKVGFSNYKDFVCIKQVDLRSIVENKGRIVFDAEQVPKDDGDFYQFVYVSHAKQIRGASIPFQFKRSHLSDYVEIEEQEAIVYQSRESAINDTIIEIKSRCDHLAQANETYEKLIKENEEIIHSLKDEIAEVKLRCMRLTMDNEKLNTTLRAKTDNLQNLADTINNLTDENKKLQTRFESLSAENMNLYETLQQRVEQVEQLKNDLKAVKTSKLELENEISHKEVELCELRKDKHELNRIADDLVNINDQVSNLEKQVNERVEELNKIKTDLRRNELLVTQQAETIQKILDERDSLNDLIQQLTKEKNELEYNQENLSQELNMSKDKLQAAEQCKEMLRSQVLVLTNELNSSNSKIQSYLAKLNESTSREKQLSAEKDELNERIHKMKQEYENKLDEANGSYYALKLAHNHLENKLKAAEQTGKEKSSVNQKELDHYLQLIDKLKHENDELKDRIKTGAKEYSKLLEKYQHVKNNHMSQDTVSSVIYHDMSGGERRRSENRAPQLAKQPVQDRFRNQHARNEADLDTDSAIQEKTLSQSTRLSTPDDVEHTLLDALLSTSLYSWQGSNRNKEQHQPPLASPSMMPITTTSQPRLQASRHNEIMTSSGYNTNSSSSNINTNYPQTTSDISDDGLIHASNQLRYRGGKRSSIEDIENVNEAAATKTLNAVNNLIKLVSDTAQSSQSSEAANTSSNIRVCDICNHIFEPDLGPHEVEKHMSLHYGPSCPVCYLLFRKGFPQKDYEDHVNSHFAN